jgi:hypothetical protein
MRCFLTVFLLFFAANLGAQSSELCTIQRKNFESEMGMVNFLFWEEDSNGNIITDPFIHRYYSNYEVLRNTRHEASIGTIPLETIQQELIDFCLQRPTKNKQHKKRGIRAGSSEIIPLIRQKATKPCTIVYYRTEHNWISQKCGMVLYFNQFSNGNLQFSHSTDSLDLTTFNYKSKATNHYFVITVWDDNGKMQKQSLWSPSDGDITATLKNNCTVQPLRFLIFANGYRGNSKEKHPSENKIFSKDVFYYWFKLDNRFAARLQPTMAFYIDGSFSVRTSNHRSRFNFGKSLFQVLLTSPRKSGKYQTRKLNQKSNEAGFEQRKEAGRIAGNAFLLATKTLPASTQVKDTIDIVCHSMGYAYSLGFLSAIESQVVLGKMYIIAPENAGYDGFDWSKFQEVWQYGSNLNQPHEDPIRQQDGIAPQEAVKNLESLPAAQGGRVFIPSDWPNKHFVHSHMVYSYDWIFDRIGPGFPGYVQRGF